MHPRIRHLRPMLQLCILGLLLLDLVFVAFWLVTHAGQWLHWPRFAAQITNTVDGAYIEIEPATQAIDGVEGLRFADNSHPYEAENSRVLVPREMNAWYRTFDEVEVAQNPAHRADLRVLSRTGSAIPLLGCVLLFAALLIVWFRLAASYWGQDVIWSNGSWTLTSNHPARAGGWSRSARKITESRGSRKAMIFWLCLFGLIAIVVIAGAVHTGSAGDVLLAVIIVSFVLLTLFALATTMTRSVHFDDMGVVDTSLLGVRRVLWHDIGEMTLENINEGAQRRWSRGSISARGSRPQTIKVHKIHDRNGRELLTIPTDMVPQPLFLELRTRILHNARGDASRATSGAAIPGAPPTPSVQAANTPDARNTAAHIDAELREFNTRQRKLVSKSKPGLITLMLLVALPFLAGTGAMCYRSLWYLFIAERAEGQVVEVAQGEAPSLIVEYRRVDGSLQRIETDGSSGYDRFHVGDKLSVMYDANRLDRVRVDLFMENWLLVIMVGALTFLLVGTLVLIYRGLNAPFP